MRKSGPRRLSSLSLVYPAKDTHHGASAMIYQMKHLRYSDSQKGR
jgi:hypothetical protein